MSSLYLENSIIGSLFRFFSQYFSTATRPTQFLLTWLVIAQLALQSFPSLRFLHRNFLSQVTHRCLNSYYRALRNETVTGRSLRLQTAKLAHRSFRGISFKVLLLKKQGFPGSLMWIKWLGTKPMENQLWWAAMS